MTTDLDDFREHVRDWLGEHCPPQMRTPMPEEEIPWGGRDFTFASDAQER